MNLSGCMIACLHRLSHITAMSLKQTFGPEGLTGAQYDTARAGSLGLAELRSYLADTGAMVRPEVPPFAGG